MRSEQRPLQPGAFPPHWGRVSGWFLGYTWLFDQLYPWITLSIAGKSVLLMSCSWLHFKKKKTMPECFAPGGRPGYWPDHFQPGRRKWRGRSASKAQLLRTAQETVTPSSVIVIV